MSSSLIYVLCTLCLLSQLLFVEGNASRKLLSSTTETALRRDDPSSQPSEIAKRVLQVSVLKEKLQKHFSEKLDGSRLKFDSVEKAQAGATTTSIGVAVTRQGNGFGSPVKGFVLKDGIQGACVRASYDKLMPLLGWSFLSVTTNVSCPDVDQAFAAGVAEGVLTAAEITENFFNTFGTYKVSPRLREFLLANNKFMTEQLNKLHAEPSEAAYWWQVRLVQEQLAGIEAGYRLVTKDAKPLTATDFLLMQMSGDLEDLEVAWKDASDDSDATQFHEPTPRDGCSAIVKLLPGNKELLTGHNTWTSLESMHRIYKSYDFPMHVEEGSKEIIPGRQMTFSSYPGCILSGDDYYTLSSGLVAWETSIDNDNMELYRKYLNPSATLLDWLRNLIANRLANSGAEWTEVFGRLNSGTYNNQWVIVDYKLFTPGKALQNGTLWVLEQLPGYVERADITGFLQKEGYWPSYNIAYFQSIFNLSSQPANVAKYGDWFSYEKAPRALIFARDHPKVKDIEGLKKLMRYNDFQNDPFGACRCSPPYTAENAIAARGDLNPANGAYFLPFLGLRDHAATDAKVTSYELMQSLASVIISGPTWDTQPPFQWSTSPFSSHPHLGQPDLYLFPWVQVGWGDAESSHMAATK